MKNKLKKSKLVEIIKEELTLFKLKQMIKEEMRNIIGEGGTGTIGGGGSASSLGSNPIGTKTGGGGSTPYSQQENPWQFGDTSVDAPNQLKQKEEDDEEQQEKLKDLDKQGRPALESDENS
tara:strand:- start:257 stop:619 length:363 start_codon:yes stop_codon:yes gene_type:complete